jgi:FixJ family two-component response regulator
MPLISIVDDDVSIRDALRRLVESGGYRVETFHSAGAFLDSASLGRTACLVLDLHLPGMSGFELRERLAELRAPFPIIFITAHDDVPTRERLAGTEAAARLYKPVEGEVLLEAIGRAVGSAERPRGSAQ